MSEHGGGEGPESQGAGGGYVRSDGPGNYDPWEPPERSGVVRGGALVILALVIGVLLMPSATRAPLSVVASRSTTTTATTLAPAGGHQGTTTPTTAAQPAASSIDVLVANATTTNGVAGSLTTFLKSKGFTTLSAVNALTTLSSSRVYFTSAGSAADANEVVGALGLTAASIQPAGTAPPVNSSTGASVVVVAGQDLATRFAPTATTAAKG